MVQGEYNLKEKGNLSLPLDQLSGIGAKEVHISSGLTALKEKFQHTGVPWEWEQRN